MANEDERAARGLPPATPPPGSLLQSHAAPRPSSGVARWRDVQPRPSLPADQIAKWKAQAIEKERSLAAKRRERAAQQHSALPSLGNDAPDRAASRVTSGMPAHLSSAQSSAAAPATSEQATPS
jgi:hypothetical protein